MQLNIVRPTGKKIVEHVAWLDIQTPEGNFVIQDEHAPMIISLLPDSQIIFSIASDKQEIVTVKTGMAHITFKSTTLLLSE